MSSYLESQRDPLTVSPHFLYCLFKNRYFLVQTILISVFIFSCIPCAIRRGLGWWGIGERLDVAHLEIDGVSTTERRAKGVFHFCARAQPFENPKT